MTLKEFLREAKRLRALADAAERELFEFLFQAEPQAFWRASGCTFEELLQREDICKPSRYAGYRQARELLGDLPKVGVEAIILAGRMRNRELAREVVDQSAQWERTNETTISEQSAEQLAGEVRTRDAAVRNTSARYTTLARENERLRKQVEQLRTQVVALRAENAELRRSLKEKSKAKSRRPEARA